MQRCKHQTKCNTTSLFMTILLQVIIPFLSVMAITVSRTIKQYISQHIEKLTLPQRFASVLSLSTKLSFLSPRHIKCSLAMACIAMLLTACGDSSFSGGDTPEELGMGGSPDTGTLVSDSDEATAVLGAGVKGPLTDSVVVAYVLDLDQPGLKGEIVANGSTDSLAQLQMRIKNRDLSKGPFLLEYQGGFELNGSAPIIDRLYTIVTEDQLRLSLPVYGTPLSSLTVSLAEESLVANASVEDFALALDVAEETVKDAFGLGDQPDLDIFETSPVLTRTESPELTFMLRRASELFAASVGVIADELASNGMPQEGYAIVKFLAEDLNDGVLDGLNGSLDVEELASIDDLSAILSVDPDLLLIPGTDAEISELDTLLLEEAEVLQKVVSAETEDALIEAASDETKKVRFNNKFVDKPGNTSSDESSTESGTTDGSGATDGSGTTGGSGTADTSLLIELTADSVNPVWTLGTEKLVEIVVSENYIDAIDCYLDVKDGNQAILGTSPELWSPYQFKLSKVGSVPAGEYTADIRCYVKGGTDAVLASVSTTLTVIENTSDTGSGDTGTGDTGTGGTGTGGTGTGDTGTGDTGTGDTGTSDTGTGETLPETRDIEFSWVWPTTREDGTALNAEDIDSFEVYYYRTGQTGVSVNVSATDAGNALVNQYVVQSLEVGSYEFAVAAVDTEGNVSAFTTPVLITVE